MSIDSLALDIDMPEDIGILLAAAGARRAAETMAMIASAKPRRSDPAFVAG